MIMVTTYTSSSFITNGFKNDGMRRFASNKNQKMTKGQARDEAERENKLR